MIKDRQFRIAHAKAVIANTTDANTNNECLIAHIKRAIADIKSPIRHIACTIRMIKSPPWNSELVIWNMELVIWRIKNPITHIEHAIWDIGNTICLSSIGFTKIEGMILIMNCSIYIQTVQFTNKNVQFMYR